MWVWVAPPTVRVLRPLASGVLGTLRVSRASLKMERWCCVGVCAEGGAGALVPQLRLHAAHVMRHRWRHADGTPLGAVYLTLLYF